MVVPRPHIGEQPGWPSSDLLGTSMLGIQHLTRVSVISMEGNDLDAKWMAFVTQFNDILRKEFMGQEITKEERERKEELERDIDEVQRGRHRERVMLLDNCLFSLKWSEPSAEEKEKHQKYYHYLPGNKLHAEDQRKVLASYVHRYTGEHQPAWALKPRPNGEAYVPHFATDAEWLANTDFKVRKDGRLDRRYRSCQSWPKPVVEDFDVYRLSQRDGTGVNPG